MEEKAGEMELILADLRSEAQEIIHELTQMESVLVKMRETVESGEVNREMMLSQIDEMRSKIGLLEHIESKEFTEEKAASNLMIKLKGMIDKCI